MASSVPVRFRGQARRDAAAFYLTQLAKGILSGEISVQSGQEQMVVATSEFMSLDIESELWKGTTVRFTLPLGIRASSSPPGPASSPPHG